MHIAATPESNALVTGALLGGLTVAWFYSIPLAVLLHRQVKTRLAYAPLAIVTIATVVVWISTIHYVVAVFAR